MTTVPCPSDEVLYQLVEDQLDSTSAELIDRHLCECPQCLSRLERLTDDPELSWESLKKASAIVAKESTVADREYWTRLARVAAASLNWGGETAERTTETRELPQIPGYRFVRVVGQGGMGLVYEAEDVRLHRRVAIKMLGERQLQADSLERLRREAEAIARLRHPHIVQIHRIDTWEERPFLELEYVAGGSLADRLKGRPHASLDSAKFVSRLARAIHFAHNEQVIHRDLKPSNVLLDTGVPASTLSTRELPLALVAPKITDFGLAKLLDSDQERTRHGQLLGTPSYAPPEQLVGEGERAGPATDIYSLGAILYELLTGRAPFQGEDVWQTVQQVRHDEPLSPRLLNPAVPRDLETICLKCLEKSPESRYPSGAALADDLDRFCDQHPIAARPVGWSGRAVRWTRRNRAVAGLLAMVALLVTVVVLGSLGSARYYYLAEKQERQLQEALSTRQNELRETNRDKSRALADSYRSLGLGAGQVGRPHLAALYFSHAAAESSDQLATGAEGADAIRVRHFLDRCPVPVALLEHPDAVRLDDVFFHPSSRWLLCQPYARTDAQYLYDLTTGERLEWPADWGRVTAAAWNVAGDRILVGTAGGWLREARFPGFEVLWEHRTGDPVRGVAVAAQGTALAAATDTRQWIWRCHPENSPGEPRPTPHLVAQIDNPLAPIVDLLFDPSGRWCLAWTNDRWLTARQTETGEPGMQVRFGWNHFDWSRIRPQFDLEGRLVVWSDFELSRVDLDRQRQTPIGRADGGYTFEVSPHDGTILVGANFRALLYTADGEQPVKGTTTYSACWLEDGTALLGATEGDSLYRLDIQKGTMAPWPLFQSEGAIRLRLSPDQQRLATISSRGQLRVWRMPGPPGAGLVQARIPSVLESDWGELSADGRSLLVRRFGENAQLHHVADGSPAGPPLVPRGSLHDARWLPDGERILTLATNAGDPGCPVTFLDVWRGATGERCQPSIRVEVESRSCEESPHNLLAVSPRGNRAAVVENRQAGLTLIDLEEGAKSVNRLPIAAEWLVSVPQRNSLIVIVGAEPGQSKEVLLIDWDTAKITRRFPIADVLGVTVSPDGNQIAVGTRQSEVWLLDPRESRGKPLRLAHPNWASPDAYSGDGRRLATRGKDRFFRIWDVPEQRVMAPVSEFVNHSHSTFCGQDRFLLTCNMWGNLELMSVVDGQPLAPYLPLGVRPTMPEEGGFRFSAGPDGNIVVVGGAPFVTLLNLVDFHQPLPVSGSDLINWCSLVSGHRLVQGHACPLSGEEWSDLWRRFGWVRSTRLSGGWQ